MLGWVFVRKGSMEETKSASMDICGLKMVQIQEFFTDMFTRQIPFVQAKGEDFSTWPNQRVGAMKDFSTWRAILRMDMDNMAWTT